MLSLIYNIANNKHKHMQTKFLLDLFPLISNSLLVNEDRKAALNEVLKLLGEASNTDRVYYFRCDQVDGQELIYYDAEWCKQGISAQINNPELNGIPWSFFPDIYELLCKKKIVYGHIEDWPESNFKDVMAFQDIKSFLFARIFINDVFMGFVGFDSCITKRNWSIEEADILSYLADIIANKFISDMASDKANILLEKLSKRNRLLNRIREIQSVFLEEKDDYSTFFMKLLDSILEYSDATLGFIIEFMPSPKMEFIPFQINSKSYWNFGGIKSIQEKNQIKDFFMSQKENIVFCLKNSEPYSENQSCKFQKSEATDFPIQNWIYLPIIYANSKRGILCLANFNKPLSKDFIEELEIAQDACGRLIHLVNIEREKKEKQEIELQNRKEYEENLLALNTELKQSIRELEIANEELEQFAFITSHDLQEPLRMVTSFMDQLKRKYANQLDEKAIQYIEIAIDGAKRMKKIILDLLEYSKAGKIEKIPTNINVNQLIEDYISLRRKIIKEKHVEIKATLFPIVNTYKVPLEQTFHCIIDNAIKYSKEDTPPSISIEMVENKDEWVFSIKDNGIGIDPIFHKKIFEVFQRLHNREKYEGTGIGLAIAKKNIESCGGRLWVESEPNIGSTFHFNIQKKSN